MTPNERKALDVFRDNPSTSQRKLVKILGLGGVASAQYLVNALVKKGKLRRCGNATKKQYIVIPDESWRGPLWTDGTGQLGNSVV